MKEIKLAYYSEQCLRRGERCYDEDMIEMESNDLTIFNISAKNIGKEREYARMQLKIANEHSNKGVNESYRKTLYGNLLDDLRNAEVDLYD